MSLPEGFSWSDSAPNYESTPDGRPRITVRPARSEGDAIASIESGGRYDIVGPPTRTGDRAYGKYQVMGANIPQWTQEVLGRQMAPHEFLADREAQDAVFNAKFGGYSKKYGPEGAARAWFAGEGGMNDPGRKDILGTSVADYSRKFTNAMGPSYAAAPPQAASDANPPMDGYSSMAQAPAMPPGGPAGSSELPSGFTWADSPPAKNTAQEDAGLAELSKMTTSFGPQVSTGEAARIGARKSLSMGFGDELAGVSAASGLEGRWKGLGDILAIPGVAQLLYEHLSGQNTGASARYAQGRDEARAINTASSEQHPYVDFAGQAAGGLLIPGIGAVKAAGQGIKASMAAGAKLGAATGTVTGVGEGEDATDRATRGAIGGVLGTVIGGSAPVVMEGARQGVRLAYAALPIGSTIRGMFAPEQQAARNFVATQARGRMNGNPGMTAPEVAQDVAAGGPSRNIDMLGPDGQNLVRSAANLSPEANSSLREFARERLAGQPERVRAVIRGWFGDLPDTEAARDALKDAARKANGPAYRKAYAEGDQAIWSPELERVTTAPFVQSAVASAITKWKNYAVRDGFGAMNPPFVVENGILKRTGGQGMLPYPNIQLWDYAARELQDAARAAPPGSQQAGLYNDLARALKNELDKIVPSYKTAREGAAGFFGAEDAIDAGKKFLTARMQIGEMRRAVAAFSEPERKLFASSVANEIITTLDQYAQQGGLRSVLNNKIFNGSTYSKAQLEAAFGPERARELEAFLRIEALRDFPRTALGNSTTAMQLMQRGLAGAGSASAGGLGGATIGGLTTGDYSPQNLMTWALISGGGRAAIDARVASKLAKMMLSNDPAIFQRALKISSRNSSIMDALRAFDTRIAASAGQKSPNGFAVPAVQGLVGARAGEDRPQ